MIGDAARVESEVKVWMEAICRGRQDRKGTKLPRVGVCSPPTRLLFFISFAPLSTLSSHALPLYRLARCFIAPLALSGTVWVARFECSFSSYTPLRKGALMLLAHMSYPHRARSAPPSSLCLGRRLPVFRSVRPCAPVPSVLQFIR